MLDALKKVGIFIFETVKVVVVSLAIILPVRFFLIQPFYVEGASMEPTFQEHEYLIIDEITYRFNDPQRGEVVVFRNPQNVRQFYIKRIIGLPGDTVKIVQGTVFINGVEIDEKYIESSNQSSDSYPETTLEEGEFFVMGDNRANSLDSRYLGSVNERYLIGRVWVRGWPFERFGFFHVPDYPPLHADHTE